MNNRLLDGDPREGEPGALGIVRRSCTRIDSTPIVAAPKDPFGDMQRESLCTMTFIFDGRGQIVAEGAMDENTFERGQSSTMAVVGGTGEFVAMQGEVEMTLLVLPGVLIKTDIRLIQL